MVGQWRRDTIRNDFVSVYISKDGEITSLLKYTNNDRDFNHSVQLINGTGAKGYFSFTAGGSNQNYSISEFYVKQNTDDVVEVQYVTNYKNGIRWVIEYIVTRDVPGVYNYAQLESKAGSGALNEARMGLRVSPTLFNYAYVNEQTQGTLPTPAEMTVGGEGGCTKVTDATYKLADGTGPMRQDLTVHATETTPIMLRHFHGNHFGGASALFTGNKKLYGPHLIYVNQSSKASVDEAHAEMVADAKTQAVVEQNVWPNYSWLRDTEVKKRGTVTGQITMSAEDADYFKTTKLQVVLAQPGSKPMLQGTDYQFWAETDADGNFIINNVREGSYSLYAYALNGSATGYYVQDDVTVTNGNTTAFGTMVWVPDANRYDEVLWQIGQSDHLADGFNMSGSIRQYGRTNSIPADLTFTIGESEEATDWYYAQAHNGTWTIKYNLTELPTYPLRLTIASAGAANAKLTVRSNETTSSNGVGVFRPVHDGSVSRCATLAGRDSVVVFDIPVSKLKVGENSLNLSVWGLSTDELGNDLGGLMYDMIKLERKNSTIQVISEETSMGFDGETVDNPTGLTAITNFNNTGFYLRGSNDYKIPLRVPGKDTRQFTFSDGTVYASQNFVTLQGQSKNDYSSLPAANGGVSEASRLNIGFQTTVPGTVYVAFQSQSNPADGSALRLVLNGNVVESASLQTAATKTARLDVLEYTATETGTFFIDSYHSSSNIFYVRFVPTGESTSIMAVTKPQTTHHTEVYNLNGQRVAHPVKGLYIINGKKVVIR